MVAPIDRPSSTRPENPYRQILRRHFPEPILALLLFLMGVWLWDNHLGHSAGYEADTCRTALLKIDRDLQLAAGAQGMPQILQSLIGIDPAGRTIREGVESLTLLGRAGALDEEGAYALMILHSVQEGKNPATAPFTAVNLPGPPDARNIVQRLAEGRGSWWDRQFLQGVRQAGGPDYLGASADALERVGQERLVRRAVIARGLVLALACCGLAFVPRVFRSLAPARRQRPARYVAAWPLGLGLGVFLLAYLASIGLGMTIEQLMRGRQGGGGSIVLPLPFLAVLDFATRFLPALIALALLFRRGRHGISRLGLDRAPDFGWALGGFALLTLAEQILQRTLGEAMPPNPTGGLSPVEAGGWGLVMAIASACIAAPVAEEILYRGVLFRALANRLRLPAATLISATVFALVHFYNAYGLVSVGLFGAVCALSVAASGRLATAILLHALYNAAIKLPEWIIYHAPLP